MEEPIKILNFNQLNQILNINKTHIKYRGGSHINRYEEFKTGISKDIGNLITSFGDAIAILFFFIGVGLCYYYLFGSYFDLTPAIKLILGIPLILFIIGILFNKRIINSVLTIWIFLFKLIFNLLLIIIFGGAAFIILKGVFFGA